MLTVGWIHSVLLLLLLLLLLQFGLWISSNAGAKLTVKFRSPSDRRTKQFANDQKVGRKKDSRQTHVTHLCNIILSHFEAQGTTTLVSTTHGTIVSP
jgi:hypothetical protein